MNLDRLTDLLADRLSAIVPSGFRVSAEDGMLWYSAEQGRFPGQLGDYDVGRSGTYVRANFGVYGTSDHENAIGIGVQALDELQDYISEATHEPWPGLRSQPRPQGKIAHSHLELWYGDGDSVILACRPIPLTDVD